LGRRCQKSFAWGVGALGNPVRFILTAGQVAEDLPGRGLINGFSFEDLPADKGCDSSRFRASIADEHARAVSSNRSRVGLHLAVIYS
jgi:transposase